MLSSAKVTPRACSNLKARRAKACPRKATRTVTKDSSMSLAMKEVKKAAVAAVSVPLVCIMRPYLGPRSARMRNSAEKKVEKTAKQMMVVDSQLPTLSFMRVLLRQL